MLVLCANCTPVHLYTKGRTNRHMYNKCVEYKTVIAIYKLENKNN
jgi:hypothetical protein